MPVQTQRKNSSRTRTWTAETVDVRGSRFKSSSTTRYAGAVALHGYEQSSVAVFLNGEFVVLSNDYYEYLLLEAKRLGITLAEAHEQERVAASLIPSLSISEAKLKELAKRSSPPQKYLDGNEECPF